MILDLNDSYALVDDGALVWPHDRRFGPLLLDQVDWIVFQCLREDDDVEGLARDVADIVGISQRAALDRVAETASRVETAGLTGEGQPATGSDEPFSLPLSH